MQRDMVLGEAQQRPRIQPNDGSPKRLRVAVVTESFLPTGNGVTTNVCRMLEHLSRRGHDAVVICPGPAPESFAGARVITVPSIPFRRFPIGLPSPRVMRTLASFVPDVVHLASPFVLGSAGVTAAGQLGVPTVAVFQPEAAGPAQRHPVLHEAAWRWIRRIHEQADVNLAPSPAALDRLRERAVPRPVLWERNVDGDRFTPRRRRTPAVAALRARLAPNGEVLVGFAGPAPSPERIAALAGLPGVRLVVIGTGPGAGSGSGCGATFLGTLDGDELADAFAALDVLVHAGPAEVGSDRTGAGSDRTGSGSDRSVAEAMSSGVPVVAEAGAGQPALLAPGLNGLLYPAGDGAALRAAVRSLAEDGDQRRWMGTAARVGVERHTWQHLGDELIEHYRALVAQRSRPTPPPSPTSPR